DRLRATIIFRSFLMPHAVAIQVTRTAKQPKPSAGARRFGELLSIAEQQGLLRGGRTLTVRGRMPPLLVEQAKKKTGIRSDSKLIEAALANIAVGDDYGEWLLAQRGTVSKDLDLEF
ncbi:MAG: hypothetical protein ACRD3S_07460, partial [Terracidiphilus sp.]